jgi:hypothetical protein
MAYRVAFVISRIKEKCWVIVHLHGKHGQFIGKVEMLMLRIDQMGMQQRSKLYFQAPAGNANSLK